MPRRRRRTCRQAIENADGSGASARPRAEPLPRSRDSDSVSRYLPGEIVMPNLVHFQPIVALVAGILILIMPRLLNFIVAIYLIFIGLVGLWPRLQHLLH
jgi:Protein of unknown function (DUF3096)